MRSSYKSVACLALLGLTSGCFQDSQNTSELEPVLDERGIITYRNPTLDLDSSAKGALASAGASPKAAPLDPTDSGQRQQDELADQEVQRNAQEQARQLRQEQAEAEQAYQDMRRNILAGQAQAERERNQLANERQRLWNQQQSQRIETWQSQLQRSSQVLDNQLQGMRDQHLLRQQQGMETTQERARNGGFVYDSNGQLIVP